MRVAAAGWLARTHTEAMRVASAQAAVSHNHPAAILAAQAVAETIFALRHGHSVSRLRRAITATYGYDLALDNALRRRGLDMSAADTVAPALAAAFAAADWEDAVRMAVLLGGDTDTLACIAGAVAEAIFAVPPDIATWAREQLMDDLRLVLDRFTRHRSASLRPWRPKTHTWRPRVSLRHAPQHPDRPCR